MGGEAVEVRVKLVIDKDSNDVAKKLQAELGGVKSGTDEAGHAAHEAKSEFSDLGKLGVLGLEGVGIAAAVAAAGIGALTVLAHEGFEAALEQQEAIKRVAGSLMMMVRDVPYDQVASVASTIHEELVNTAEEVGVASEDMVQAFDTISAHSSLSVSKVQELTEKMALAGRAVPGGIGALAQGMTGFEQGMIRARNPVVQMIAATGTLQGNAKEVAKQLQAMAPEKQMELAEKAIAKMGDRMKDVPLTFPQVIQSLRDVKDQIMETLGGPILKSITSIVGDISNFFQAHKEQIMEVAEHIGSTIAKFIDMTAALISEIISVFTGDVGSVTNSFEDVVDEWGDKFDDIKGDAHEIAETFKTIVEWASNIIDGILTANRVAAAIATAGLSEVAIAAVSGDNSTNPSPSGQQGAKDDEENHRLDRMKRAFAEIGGSAHHMEKAEESYRKAAIAAGETGEYIEFMIKQAKMQANDLKQGASAELAAIDHAKEAAESGNSVMAADWSPKGTQMDAPEAVAGAQIFIENWQKIQQSGDQKMMEEAAKKLEASKILEKAVLDSGAIIDGAIIGLGAHIKDAATKASVLADEKKAVDAGHVKPDKSINMSGGQTFNIKQDFRDQDPDRVAVVFRRDIAKNVVNRLTAKNSFGMT